MVGARAISTTHSAAVFQAVTVVATFCSGGPPRPTAQTSPSVCNTNGVIRQGRWQKKALNPDRSWQCDHSHNSPELFQFGITWRGWEAEAPACIQIQVQAQLGIKYPSRTSKTLTVQSPHGRYEL